VVTLGQTYNGSSYTGNYGISAVDDSGNYLFKMDSGSIEIAGWSFDEQELLSPNGDLHIRSAVNSIYIRPNTSDIDMVCLGQTFDGNSFTGNYGVAAVDGSGNWLFRLDDGAREIAGWSFTENYLNSANDRVTISSYRNSIYIHPPSGVDYISMGQVFNGSGWTGNYGMAAVDTSGNYLFRLDDGAQQIAGWSFDNTRLWSGTNTPGGGSFTGIALDSSGISYDGTDYNIVGVNGGTLQVGIRQSDGALYAGGGAITLSSSGQTIEVGSSYDSTKGIKFSDGTNNIGNLWGRNAAGGLKYVQLRSDSPSGDDAYLSIEAEAVGASDSANVSVSATVDGSGPSIILQNVSGTHGVSVNCPMQVYNHGIWLGDAVSYVGTNPASGGVWANGDIRVGGGLYVGSTGTDPGDGVVHAEDYGVFMGGIHVGGSSDPGTDNLIVDGDIGIGTAPSHKLHAEGNQTGAVAWLFNDGGTSDYYGLGIQCGADDGSQSYLLLARDGDNTSHGGLEITGGTVQVYQTSDEHWKQNVRDTEVGLKQMMDLRVRDFEWREKPGGGTGFVAQEAQDIVPGFVGTDPDGFQTVRPLALIPVMVRALQEQQDQIVGLQERIVELEAS
jgi:hypothetical protein